MSIHTHRSLFLKWKRRKEFSRGKKPEIEDEGNRSPLFQSLGLDLGGNRAADRITFFKTDILRNSRLKHIMSEPLGQRVLPRIGKDALLLVFLQRTQ